MDKDKFISFSSAQCFEDFHHSLPSFSLLKPNNFSPSSVYRKGQSEELGGAQSLLLHTTSLLSMLSQLHTFVSTHSASELLQFLES